MSQLEIGVEDVGGPDPRALLAAFQRELYARWSGPPLEADPGLADPGAGLSPPGGLFLVARVGGAPAGCVGVRTLAPGVGEMKRMFVLAEFRGQGLGRRLLVAVEGAARRLGHTRLRLDTMAELVEARAMYASAGYVDIPPYTSGPYVRFWLEKALAVPA